MVFDVIIVHIHERKSVRFRIEGLEIQYKVNFRTFLFVRRQYDSRVSLDVRVVMSATFNN